MRILNNVFSLPLILMALSITCFVANASAAEPENENAEAMYKDCKELMTKHKEMEADKKSQDEMLTKQITAMNQAPNDQKLLLIAETLTTMSQQRTARDTQQAKMHNEMMKHMMKMGHDSICPMNDKDSKDKKMMGMKKQSTNPTVKEKEEE